MKEILAIGNPVYDIIETPYINSNGRVLSGCSTNAALTIGKLGGKAHLLGRIGEDFKNDFIKVLEMYGVVPHPISSSETGGFHLIYKDKYMRDRDLFILGIADKIAFKHIPSELLSLDGFILGPILQEIDYDFILELRRHAEDSVMLLDPQGTIREIREGQIIRVKKEWVLDAISKIDIVKPNEHEAETLYPNTPYEKTAVKISNKNGKIGIVTLADRGSIVAFDGKVYHIPAYRTTERDPTGCGDVYGGAFLYQYLKVEDPVESAIFASATASFMVETTGPHFKIDKKELDKRIEWIQERVKKI